MIPASSPTLSALLLLLTSYLLGSIPTSVWVGRLLFGIDIRTRGSGNAGGTNTLRVFGWRAAAPVVLVDVGKGALAAWLATRVGAGIPSWLPVTCLAAAVLGHTFPVFARFRGGKGVATAAGGLCVLAPWAALACAVLWLAVVGLTRIVSLASVLAALVLPLTVVLLPGRRPAGLVPLALGLTLFVLWTHRSNLGRLARGEEPPLIAGRPPDGP
ncbi:MAG: glycerol-3-phosphate 1-O-acyltransferase PlsY [Acidobacteriota bacterium]